MEWLEGQTLADRLQRRGLTLPEAVSVVRQAAEALAGGGSQLTAEEKKAKLDDALARVRLAGPQIHP